jgi:hypothetical protein
VLSPGVYTLAIGGANFDDYMELYFAVRASLGGHDATAVCGEATCANRYAASRLARNLSITGFSVTPVPAPAAAWLFGTALVAIAARSRRRARAPA